MWGARPEKRNGTWQNVSKINKSVVRVRSGGPTRTAGVQNMMVRPVAVEVPGDARLLRGSARVRDLSLRARDAVALSAIQSGLLVPDFDQDALGRPIPSRGVFWSIAHKSTMVVGVAASCPIGVDVERIRPRSQEQIDLAMRPRELEVLGGDPVHAYFCGWVAKEATLKLWGEGLPCLSQTQVLEAWSDGAWVSFAERRTVVSYAFLSGHVAAVTWPSRDVQWTVMLDRARGAASPCSVPVGLVV